MALEAAGALDQQIDGGQVGDQQVEIQIEGLFHHLGGDEHPAAALGGAGILAETFQHPLLDGEAVGEGETGVEQVDVPVGMALPQAQVVEGEQHLHCRFQFVSRQPADRFQAGGNLRSRVTPQAATSRQW